MTPQLPKIVKDAQRLRAMIEGAWVRMARRHKYGAGADIRAASKAVVVGALRAWRDRENRVVHARELCAAVDVLKLELQLGKDVGVFGSTKEFEAIGRLAIEIGQQSGGWLKRLLPAGQNVQRDLPLGQRAPTLSARDASRGANP